MMPSYVARQIDPSGSHRREIIEAPSLAAAQGIARQRDGMLVSVKPLTPLDRAGAALAGRRRRVHSAMLQRFCHTLAAYLKAGISIQEALRLLGGSSPSLEPLTEAVRRNLANGLPLDRALAQSGYAFPKAFLSLVRVGLEAGKIDDILENEAQREKTLIEIRRDLTASLIYPAILMVMSTIVILFMLGAIVPQIRSGMPEEAVARAPVISQVIFAASDLLGGMASPWGLAATAIVGLIFLVAIVTRWAAIADRLVSLPLVRSIATSLRAASFCHSLGMMLQSGVRLEIAWRLSTASVRSAAARALLDQAGARILQGAPMAAAIGETRIMPPDVVSLFALGERTGTLPRLLIDVAQLHAGDALAQLRKLSGILVPIIILISGLLVGSFAVAMMTTIQSVNQIYGG